MKHSCIPRDTTIWRSGNTVSRPLGVWAYTNGSVHRYDKASGYVCKQCEYYIKVCWSINTESSVSALRAPTLSM